MSNYYNSPYYTVYDGINQVKVYRRIPPKTNVKEKITFSLLNLSAQCITKSSTSFHPVDSLAAHSSSEGPIKKENIMATRIRNIWYKFKKWLQYHPEKNYFRGHSD